MSDETKPLRQCYDCGGVTTHGGASDRSTRNANGSFTHERAWMCLWCMDGWEGWPRVGSWKITTADDRTYPEGSWGAALSPAFETQRLACIARGCVPPA